MSLDTFFDTQLSEWPMAHAGHEALTRVWSRALTSPKLPTALRVQCNPARIVSTGASIDKATIAARPCFLCGANRPKEQRSTALNGEFEWLVNPFPILRHHYTIASTTHRRQSITEAYDALIQATKALTEEYIVFYNGPKCGASAPDHLHLQAGIGEGIPLVEYAKALPEVDEQPCQAIAPFGYMAYLIRDAEESTTFDRLYAMLPLPEGEYEPRMNVVAYRQGERVRLIVIPRHAHRPHCYAAEGDARYLISPGALDMCGLIVTPRTEDYERLTAAKAAEILCEVGVRTEPTIDVGIMQGEEIRFTIMAAPSTPPEGELTDITDIGSSIAQPLACPRTPPERELTESPETSPLLQKGITYCATIRKDTETNNSHIIIRDEDKEYIYGNSTMIVSSPSGGVKGAPTPTFSLHGVTIGKEFHWQQQETQTFQGSLILRIIDGELHAINRIAIEDYLTSVIASEMSGTSSVELLKAHAVISRSWLLAQIKAAPSTPPEGELTDIADNATMLLDRYKTAHPDIYRLLKDRAKSKKQIPTEAERCLWEMLRAKQLGKKFRRQHIIGDFIVDFVCLDSQLIIEVDGKYHNAEEQKKADKLRSSILNKLGYRILRFTNEEIISTPDIVVNKIKSAMINFPQKGELKGPKSTMPASSPSGGVEGAAIRWYDREAHTHFDVCADDHCQRYQGVSRKVTPQVHEAIRATRGIVLSYEGEVCDARFSKCCGGKSELYESCWDDTPHPYLSVVDDPFCNTDDPKILSEVLNHYDQSTDFYRWTVEYTQEELSELVRRKGGFDYGDIVDLIPIERGPSGRIVRLQIVGTKATRIIGKELEIRRTLSETHLYSSAFEVEKKDGLPQPPPEEGATESAKIKSSPSGGVEGASFILHGRGWGHGVGLCQIGAAVMGAKGYKFDEILHHYYPEATLTEWYE